VVDLISLIHIDGYLDEKNEMDIDVNIEMHFDFSVDVPLLTLI
jgi:hypothetical protein